MTLFGNDEGREKAAAIVANPYFKIIATLLGAFASLIGTIAGFAFVLVYDVTIETSKTVSAINLMLAENRPIILRNSADLALEKKERQEADDALEARIEVGTSERFRRSEAEALERRLSADIAKTREETERNRNDIRAIERRIPGAP